MDALERLANQGSCPAAWLEAQYLLDLFDVTRLAGEHSSSTFAAAHALLWKRMGFSGPPGRGPLATQQIFEKLTQKFRTIAPQCPEKENSRQALDLLLVDSSPRASVKDALAAVVTYKKIARSSSSLRPNALLRLTDWCESAFQLAAGGDPALQHRRLNQCLFPLFDADPRPYFEADPENRPTDPPWTIFSERLQLNYRALAQTRFNQLAQHLARQFESFRGIAAAILPTEVSLSHTPLPVSEIGIAWDRTPIVHITRRGFLVGGNAILAEDSVDLEAAIARRLHNDRRGRVTITTEASTPLGMVTQAARAARRAGATVLELGVMKKVAASSPAGDVQATLFGGQPIFRLEVIPVSLLLFSSQSLQTSSRELPHGLGDDPRRAMNELAIRFSSSSMTFSSRDGILAPPPASALHAILNTLHKYYPDDASLMLVPDPTATYRDLIHTAEKVRQWRRDGLSFGLALATAGHLPPPQADLNALFKRWERAVIGSSPKLSTLLSSDLLKCYWNSLRSVHPGDPVPTGTLLLRQSSAGFRRAGGSLKELSLQNCATNLINSMPPTRPRKIEISFTLGPD